MPLRIHYFLFQGQLQTGLPTTAYAFFPLPLKAINELCTGNIAVGCEQTSVPSFSSDELCSVIQDSADI